LPDGILFIFAENDLIGAWGFPQQAKYFEICRQADFKIWASVYTLALLAIP
jgi:hypothetical protein